MKKIIALICVLGILYGIWYLSGKTASTPVPLSTNSASTDSTVEKPDASNATFAFEDGPVTLKEGKASVEVVAGSSSTEDTSLSDTTGYADINKDGNIDSFVTLIQSGAGTGTFIYLAGYISGPTGYKGTNAVFIGDRIQPKSITIENNEVTISYLDRKSDEPMDTEPTIAAYKTFTYSSGKLIEK